MGFKGTKGKGKWKYYKAVNCSKNKHIVSTEDGRGLFISGYHSNACENEYNALLISKAPEMLEMLEELVYQFERINNSAQEDELLEQAQQLIKQATEL